MVTDRKLYKYGNAIDFNKMDTIEIKGLGKVGIVYNSFDKQLKEFKKAGAKFVFSDLLIIWQLMVCSRKTLSQAGVGTVFSEAKRTKAERECEFHAGKFDNVF